MTIAVHISFAGNLDPAQNFNYHNFSLLAALHPEHHFIFISDAAFDLQIIKHKNITLLFPRLSIKNRLLRYYWYNSRIPRLLKKYNADLFFCYGIACSLHIPTKQFIYLPDISFLQKKDPIKNGGNKYQKKYLKKVIEKTACIAVGNDYLLSRLAKDFPGIQDKIRVLKNDFGLHSTQYDPGEIENIKARYSGGKEYFIFFVTGMSAGNLVAVLKAFSLFKKRLLSNMQLMLAISQAESALLIKDLATYKYRDEIKVIVCEPEKESQLTAAAYAAIYLPRIEVLENKGILAMKNNIPIITVGNDFMKSIYKDAALYTNMDEKDLAEKMILLYKDENFRAHIIQAGSIEAAAYLPGSTAAKLWEVLTGTAAQSS